MPGDRDAVETVRVEVAGARASAPVLGGRDRAPCAVASRQVVGAADGVAVDPDTPPVRPVANLEHRDAVRRPGPDRRRDLVVGGAPAREGDLVVEAAEGEAGEAAVADLDPLARAARAEAGAAHADPAGDMAVLDGGLRERGQRGADA